MVENMSSAYNQSPGQGGAQGLPALQSLLAAAYVPVQPVSNRDIKAHDERAQCCKACLLELHA